MNDIDREAGERAIEQMRAESADSRALIDALIARDGLEEAGQTAAYHCQCQSLRLKPWQPPPMHAEPRTDGPDDGTMGHCVAEQLLYRMLSLGLSRFEPDPIKAIERIERERAA